MKWKRRDFLVSEPYHHLLLGLPEAPSLTFLFFGAAAFITSLQDMKIWFIKKGLTNINSSERLKPCSLPSTRPICEAIIYPSHSLFSLLKNCAVRIP